MLVLRLLVLTLNTRGLKGILYFRNEASRYPECEYLLA